MAGLLTAASCQKKEDSSKNPDHTTEAALEQTQAEAAFDEARRTDTTGFAIARTGVEKIIADNKERIAEFRVKANAASAEERAKLNSEIDKLETRNNQLMDELTKFQEKTDEDLREFVSKVNADAAKMQEDINTYRKDHY